jgi:hypothetical protein
MSFFCLLLTKILATPLITGCDISVEFSTSYFVGKIRTVILFLDDQARVGIFISESVILISEFKWERRDEEKVLVKMKKLHKKIEGKYVHRRWRDGKEKKTK